MNGLFNLFIRSVGIDWTRIERNSYLREIPAIAGAERIDFARNITLERTERESPPCWRLLPWRMDLTRRAGR